MDTVEMQVSSPLKTELRVDMERFNVEKYMPFISTFLLGTRTVQLHSKRIHSLPINMSTLLIQYLFVTC